MAAIYLWDDLYWGNCEDAGVFVNDNTIEKVEARLESDVRTKIAQDIEEGVPIPAVGSDRGHDVLDSHFIKFKTIPVQSSPFLVR